MKKVISVVTGANGFIGSHLVAYLLEQGHEVKCIVRETSNLKWMGQLDVQFVKCGLNDVAQLSAAFEGATYIFHLAGVTRAKKFEDYIKGNVDLTENVLQACEEHSSIEKIIVTSSLAASAPARLDEPVTEETASQPISLYGKSKVEMERILKQKYNHLPYVIVRPPVVYGPRDTEVLLFFKTVQKGLVSKIGLGKKQVSLVYIDDLVRGLFLAATKENALRQTYFFASHRILDWEGIGTETAAILGKKAMKLSVPHFAVYIVAGIAEIFNVFQQKAPTLNLEKAKEITKEAWTCSDEKARKELGYEPLVSMKEGFKITLDWYKENNWL